jgi:hypothetical protein
MILLATREEKAFNKVTLKYHNKVTNYTNMTFLDTVAYVGMDTLGLCDIELQIKPLSDQAKQNFGSNVELKALIFGNGNQYVIWIDEMGREESINTISHELIHLLQYKSREFVYEGMYVYWNRSKYDFKEMPYETRPWEVDAFEKQVPLQRKIRGVLY